MPVTAIAVLTLLMIQLLSLGRTVTVVLTAPLGLIGVIGALLLFGQPFGFVAMLGTIAMFGIIMRNSVSYPEQVLAEQKWRNATLSKIQARGARCMLTMTFPGAFP